MMSHLGLNALPIGGLVRNGAAGSRRIAGKAIAALILAAGLAGCAHPPQPVAYIPPPAQGHVYQVMVQVPPPIRHYRHAQPTPREVQQAFNVIALKSALMVAALSCNQQDQYNRFMTAFQPHVLAEQRVMDTYFNRNGGRAKEDDFVTLLANNQSVSGITQGSSFCLNNIAEYKAVLALKTDSDLDNFVTDLPPNAPIVLASARITPLAPSAANLHVAVVTTSRHVHLIRPRRTHTVHKHVSEPTVVSSTARPVAVADRATNPNSAAQ